MTVSPRPLCCQVVQCEYPSTGDESRESRYGKHNGWNSRDYWPETFGERTVLESEFKVHSVCENTKNERFFRVPLFCFK